MEVLGLLVGFIVMLMVIYAIYGFVEDIWVSLFLLTFWSISLLLFIASILNIYGVGD